MPETAFLGAQIAPKLLCAGALPQTPLALLLREGERRGGEDPEKLCTMKNSLE